MISISKRKAVAIIALVLVLLAASVMTTMALMTDKRVVTNTFEFGQVRIQVTETATGSGRRVIRPSESITKDPRIENVGDVECFVRAVIAVSDNGTNGQTVMDYLRFTALGNGWYVPAGASEEWNRDSQVTVYYRGVLEAGASTSKIFTGFTLNADNGGQALLEGANNAFNIEVVAEAVQASVNGVVYDSAEAAFAGVTAYPAEG